jgi:serine protease Do
MFRKSQIVIWTLACLIAGFGAAMLLDSGPTIQAQPTSAMPGAPASFSKLAKAASPSVVNISAVKVLRRQGQQQSPFGPGDPFRDFFDRFFRDQMPKDFKQRSLGSGFVIDKEGYILTNNHVVEKTAEIEVRLADETEYKAKIIGRDPKTDLALIKIKPKKPLTPLKFGDSEKLEVGDWVVAIGSPFGLGHTVTAGIVSAKYRRIGASSYDNFIQTDASINPGNSGGPLLNTSGEVVGINTAIFTRSGGSIGIGFAIPINMAKDLLPQLKKGKVVRGWLGVMIQRITPELKDKFKLKERKGALVAGVTSGGPAEKAGIKRGDVIVSFDGKEIKEMEDLPYIVASTPVGKAVEVRIIRKGKEKKIKVKIGELEAEKAAKGPEDAKPYFGLTVEEITPDMANRMGLQDVSGVLVVQVASGSAAADAGIRNGDVIVEVDQVPVKDPQEFNQKMAGYRAGDTVLLLIRRHSATLFVTMKVPE